MNRAIFVDDLDAPIGRALSRRGRGGGFEVVGTRLKRVDDWEDSPEVPAGVDLHRVFLCRRPTGTGSIESLGVEEWDRSVMGYLAWLRRAIQICLAAMPRHGGASITILLEPDVEASVPDGLVSATTAAAAGGFIRAAAMDLAPDGVRVNGVAKGLTSPIADEVREELRRAARVSAFGWESVPVQHGTRPDELARAMWFLAGGAASSVTGSILRVDGGIQAHRFRKRHAEETHDVAQR